jgi:transcriptional regulator with XRE-family HTH domain
MNAKLKLQISQSGKRQYEVARLAGLNETELSQIVRERRSPTPEERRRIAAVLAVDEPDLFGSGCTASAS